MLIASLRVLARVSGGSNRFDSKLATGSGYTNTGVGATKNRYQMLAEQASKEKQEVEELKELLSRTLYTSQYGTNTFKRAGNVATNSLQKLNDGQNDDVVILRKRRIEEEEAAAVATGKPYWDSTRARHTYT